MVRQDVSFEQLLESATGDAGIYAEHLRRHLEILQENQELGTVFKQIVSTEAFKIERKTRQIYQLDSMGLIKIDNNVAKTRCVLYQEYFRIRL